jgi:hypothetical protein
MSLKATTSIEDPSFTQIWNLLDIVSIFSDNGWYAGYIAGCRGLIAF